MIPMPSTWLIGIDPGAKGCGIAALSDGEIRAATYLREKPDDIHTLRTLAVQWVQDEAPGRRVHVVLERPQVYTHSKSKGDPNDLITISIQGGIVAGGVAQVMGGGIELVLPATWKGQVDADVMTRRIFDRLSPAEQGRLDADVPKSLVHNMLDACGILLWKIGRL